jgi:catechol 2,3-dioxygenase-like lactoylglutathione lyase family enzyme
MRAALEQRGVSFLPTSWYQPGGIADFYDPDGHWLTLYEPSREAMMWPSGDRIRALMRARQQRSATPSAPETESRLSGAVGSTDLRLHGSDILYLFFFVQDPDEAFAFYHESLGLLDLEGGPCSRATSGDEDGVIKWDAGGLLLTTHHIDGARSVSGVVSASEVEEHTCPPREIDEKRMKGVAPVFLVKDIEHVVQELSRNRVDFSHRPTWSDIGAVASFEDPSGHMIFLYEPSAKALQSSSGAKIKEILAIPLPDRQLQLLREAFPDNRFRDDYSEEGLPAC